LSNISKVKVEIVPGKLLELKIPKGYSVWDLLLELKINPEEVIVLREGIPVTEEEEVRDGDYLQVIRVASGG